MKKKLIISVLCMTMLLPGIKALASNPSEIRYCFACGSGSSYWGTEAPVHHTEVHRPITDYLTSDGKPIYGPECTVTYVQTPVTKICSKCNRVLWSGICYDEFHSSCGGTRRYYD